MDNSSNGVVELATVSPRKAQQSVTVQTSEIPRWARLLAAPACCGLLGLLISPKFLVLAVIYGLTSLRPLYSCYRHSCSPSTQRDTSENHQVQQQLDAALSLHRSLTVQFAMLAILLWIYEHSRLLCMPKNDIDDPTSSNLVVHRAFEMAKRLVHWEHAVGLAIEPKVQGFIFKHCQWIITVANTYYAILHFVAPVGVMGRLIVYYKDPRYEFRVGFFIMLFFALLLFTFVPTMPPRLLPSYKVEYVDTQQIELTDQDAEILAPYWNIIDTMKQGETLYDKLHKEGGNPYAAMPSMHTGWALWSCLTWISTLDSGVSDASRRYQKGIAIAHVVCMVFVIVVTGNHFWLDAAAGATCVMIGRFLARKFVDCVGALSEGNGTLAHILRRSGSWLGSPPPAAKFESEKLREYDEEELTHALTESPNLSRSGTLSRTSSSGSQSSAV